MLNLILQALWYILPAYVANSTPVLLHGKTPIDFNLKFFDKRPWLGKGKTIKGFLFSVAAGTLTGVIQAFIENPDLTYIMTRALFVFGLSFGAMTGDSVGSFIKRRFNLKRGQAVPLLDQWDFLIGAIAFAGVAEFFLGFGDVLPDLTLILVIFVITPVFHILTNFLSYKLKLKDVPW